MTFAFTMDHILLVGNRKIAYGTYTNTDGGIGGQIETQLRTLYGFTLTPLGASVVSDVSTVNHSLTAISTQKIVELSAPRGLVTIVTPSNQIGFWLAIGV